MLCTELESVFLWGLKQRVLPAHVGRRQPGQGATHGWENVIVSQIQNQEPWRPEGLWASQESPSSLKEYWVSQFTEDPDTLTERQNRYSQLQNPWFWHMKYNLFATYVVPHTVLASEVICFWVHISMSFNTCEIQVATTMGTKEKEQQSHTQDTYCHFVSKLLPLC